MTRNMGLVAALATAILALGTSGSAADDAVRVTQEVSLAGGKEKFRVPADWKLESAKSDRDLECWKVTLPDGLGAARLYCGKYTAAREEVVATAALAWEFAGAEFETKPIPLTVRRVWGPDAADWLEFDTIRMAKRRGYLLAFQTARSSADRSRDAFAAAARSLESSRPEAPEVPPEYKSVARDGYLYRLHPSVAEADLAPVHKLFLDVEAGIGSRYGAVPKSAANPLVIVVHADAADSANLCEEAAEDRYGTAYDQPNGTLYIVPPKDGDWIAAGRLAESWTFALLDQTFGVHFESWLFSGEALLSACETTGGRRLPEYPAKFAALIPQSLIPFEEMADAATLPEGYEASSMVYLAFFRGGGTQYTDAFAAYAKQIRAGTNPKVALRRSLLALDQDALNAAAAAFLGTFKVFAGK